MGPSTARGHMAHGHDERARGHMHILLGSFYLLFPENPVVQEEYVMDEIAVQ